MSGWSLKTPFIIFFNLFHLCCLTGRDVLQTHKKACTRFERLITTVRIELFSLLCLHSFQTGAEVMVHVQFKLTVIACSKVGFSQESARVKTLLARHLSLPSEGLTHPQGIVEAAQLVPSRVQHWKAAVVSLDARNITQMMSNIVSLCTLIRCSEEDGELNRMHRAKPLPGWSGENWQDKGKKLTINWIKCLVLCYK